MSSTATVDLASVVALASSAKEAKSLGHGIYEGLRRGILRGEIPPGQRLVEEPLAAALGASRTPVREALQRLWQENLVEKLRYGGYEVKRITVKEIEEIFGIRSVLESYAAVLATRRMDRGLMGELQEIIEKSRQILDKGDVEEFIALNTEFHDKLYRASGSERLYRMIHDLRDHFYRFRRVILSRGSMPRISLRDHELMMEAMAKGEERRVETLVRRHILRGMKVVLREIKRGTISMGTA
ncbi:MAG: GntR family transcriptional regulator [Thermodesulfobacteriota bacterium]